MEIKGKYGTCKVFTKNLEESAYDQIKNLVDQEFTKGSKIRIMPDVHQGMGCVIGFTGDLGDKVIPNIVGVDIGCGMLTVRLKDIDIDLPSLDKVINTYVPAGTKTHKRPIGKFERLDDLLIIDKLKNLNRIRNSLGSLGGGNHFIEVSKDSRGDKYLIIHSGSRNLGKQVADYYQKLAIELRKDKDLPKDLAYLEGQERIAYLKDMKICQEYASYNRLLMANLILERTFGKDLEEFEYFETIHNYIDFRDNIIRKGAVASYEGEDLLIPINMRDGSILARGKGNPDWNYSAPHGAGRILSRTQAKNSLSMDEFKDEMKGVYSSSIKKSTLDESPMAYKPMEEILSMLGDTADLIDILRPIYNFKA